MLFDCCWKTLLLIDYSDKIKVDETTVKKEVNDAEKFIARTKRYFKDLGL